MTAKIKSLGVGFALVSTMTTTVGCVGPYNYYNSFSYIGDNQITLSTLSIEEKVKRVKYFKVEKYDCNSANQNVTAKNVYKVCKLINIVQNYMDTDDTDKMISVATRNEYGYLNWDYSDGPEYLDRYAVDKWFAQKFEEGDKSFLNKTYDQGWLDYELGIKFEDDHIYAAMNQELYRMVPSKKWPKAKT